MTRRFAIVTDSAGSRPDHAATANQRDMLTGYLEGKGWPVWHWLEDLWLVVTSDETVTVLQIREEIQEAVSETINVVVLEVANSKLAGHLPKASVPWLRTHWKEDT